MKIVIAVIAFFATLATAQVAGMPDVVADGHPFCGKTGYQRIDKSKYYKAGVNVPTAICVKQFLDVCYTVEGAKPCSKDFARCVSSPSNWNDATFNPVSNARMTDRPQICASEGAFWHPETGVLSVAQPIISFIVGVVALVLVYQGAVKKNAPLLVRVLLIVQFVVCTLLFFSYYYLNAQMALLATFAAVGLIAAKDKGGLATAIVILLATLFWFTFENGLGEIQHHSRFSGSYTANEVTCNNYYRGFFGYPVLLHGPYESPRLMSRGYCLREWLAAEYFFIILVKLLLLVLIAYAVQALRAGDAQPEPVVVVVPPRDADVASF